MSRPDRAQDARSERRGDAPERSDARSVAYLMDRSRRTVDAPALERAAAHANRLGLPLRVAVAYDPDEPGLTPRTAAFAFGGLRDVASGLARRGVAFEVAVGDPVAVGVRLARHAALLVLDAGHLRHERAWRERLARTAGVAVEEVDADVVVPVRLASDRHETAARTFRPRVWRQVERFLAPVGPVTLERRSDRPDPPLDLPVVDPREGAAALARLPVPSGPPPIATAPSGTRAANAAVRRFLDDRFGRYVPDRQRPDRDASSGLSPYLRFGQISPRTVAARARDAAPDAAALDAFLEQLIVRRELSFNHVLFAPDVYDRYEGLPAWARATLDAHRHDPREALPSEEELEEGRTPDPDWNAAMAIMRATGGLHNHMRMYWAKRILAWSPSPEEGHARTLRLNDRWFLDGRDPNSYAGVGWAYGLHDRPWPERAVFGTVRSMTPGGLARKADPEAWRREAERRIDEERSAGGRG